MTISPGQVLEITVAVLLFWVGAGLSCPPAAHNSPRLTPMAAGGPGPQWVAVDSCPLRRPQEAAGRATLLVDSAGCAPTPRQRPWSGRRDHMAQ